MSDTAGKDPVYLRSNTKIEPLCCRWYAWSHLISPLQLALNITFRQLPLLRSFIANPAVHENASKDLKFMGGSFVQLARKDMPAVRALLSDMTQRCARLIRLAEDYVNFNRQYQTAARGSNVDHLYESLPESLAGLMELTYDIDNHPTLLLIEPLLYLDRELNVGQLQELSFFLDSDRNRKFFLNTPRVDAAERFLLPMSFADSRIDLLAASRLQAVSFTTLAEELGVPESERLRFREYFTPAPPQRRDPDYYGDGLRLRYFGHACILLQTSETSILIDPLFTWDHDDAPSHLSFADLPDVIDYVFITHNHHDHFSPEVFLQLRNRIRNVLIPRNTVGSVADASLKGILRSLGHPNVTVMDPLDRVTIPAGSITSLPFFGEHAALNVAAKHGMHVELKGRKLVFLADSNCLDPELYRRIVQRLGKVDTLFIGMECQGAPLSWVYGPYLTNPIGRKDDEARRSNGSDSERAWALLQELGCTRTFVYAMGQEPWFRYHLDLIYTPDSKQIVESNKYLARCNGVGIPAERLEGCREMQL